MRHQVDYQGTVSLEIYQGAHKLWPSDDADDEDLEEGEEDEDADSSND